MQNKESDLQANDMENFKMVTEHFRQDLREFWTRANFFLLAQTALFSAFVAFFPSIMENGQLVVIVVPVFGMMLSVYWYLVLRGAIYWIKQWRQQVITLSKELDRFGCYAQIETSITNKRSLSPSYLTQFLPLLFAIIWAIMLSLTIFYSL